MHNALQKWPYGGVLCKGCYQNTLTGIKADYNSTDKLFRSIFRYIFQNIKPSFFFFFKFQEFFDRTSLFVLEKDWYGRNLST